MKKRLLSLLLAVCMVATLFTGLTVNASAGLLDKYLDSALLEELGLEDTDLNLIWEHAKTPRTSGTFGVDGTLEWSYSGGLISGGTLTITGTGAMEDFDFVSGELAPWWNVSCILGIKKVEIADTVTNIGEFAFCALPKLESITLPAGLTALPRYAIAGCNSLAFPKLPDTLTTIGDYALAACDKFTRLELPASVTAIGNRAFAGCDGITGIDLPETVQTLGSYVFTSCDKLVSAILPASITAVPEGCFYNCSVLSTVRYNGAVTEIGAKAFSSCPTLLKAPIPETVTAIGDYAFQGCDKIASATLPQGLRSLGKGAFSGCKLLSSIVLPDAITVVPEDCFSMCAISDVTFAPNTTEIGAKAFNLCIVMKSIDLPDTLKTIGESAFSGCEKLEHLTLPAGLETIGDFAFSGCSALTEVSFLAGTAPQTVGASAFALCTALEDAYCYGNAPTVTAADATGATFVKSVITIHYPQGNDTWVVSDSKWNGYNATPWNVCRHENVTRGETVAPTCTAKGYTVYTCNDCGKTLHRDETAMRAHDLKPETVPPTCTEAGYTKYVCKDCGYEDVMKRTDYTAPAGHEYVLTETITPATCTIAGEGVYTCSVCGKTETRALPKTAHTPVTMPAVAPTCTTAGKTEGSRCTVCGAVLAEQKIIPATGHTQVVVPAVAPTCTTEGKTAGVVCSICRMELEKRETTPALGHSYTISIRVEPTETQDGYVIYTCSRCGDIRTETLPATGSESCTGGADCPQAKFTDKRAPSHWAHSAIDYCVANGILYGVEDTRFGCSESTTRGQLVTMLYRMQGSPAKYEVYFVPFVDVSPTAYYYAAIAWAYDNGIVAGTSTTTFSPQDPITREQMATILYNYTLKYAPDRATGSAALNFPDAGSISQYAVEPLQWAVANDIISGTKENGAVYLDPKGTATREQVASILMRYLTQA